MKRRHPEQLVLPGTLHEVVELRKQRARAEAAVARLHDEINALTSQVATLTSQLENARQAAQHWQKEYRGLCSSRTDMRCSTYLFICAVQEYVESMARRPGNSVQQS